MISAAWQHEKFVQISPLEVTVQPSIPCSTHRHVRDITQRPLKEGVSKRTAETTREGRDRDRATHRLAAASASAKAVKSRGAARTGQTTPKRQKHQSGLGGWHTLRLGPVSGAEKWCKKITALEH